MKLLLIVALGLCIYAVRQLPVEVPGLLTYLWVQMVTSAWAFVAAVLWGVESEGYRQAYYAGQSAAIFAVAAGSARRASRYGAANPIEQGNKRKFARVLVEADSCPSCPSRFESEPPAPITTEATR